MGKKINIALSMLMALAMAFAFAGCKDDDGDVLGKNFFPTIDQANEQVQEMPETSDEAQIEAAISEVFGVDIQLPSGTYSAETYSYGGMSSYMVTVSGSNQTATEYYNSIKAEMIAKGYTADETELGFYKVVGTIVYSVAVEGYGGEIVVYSGVSSFAQDSGGSEQGGTQQGGGGILPGGGGILPGGGTQPSPESGDLTAWPAAAVQDMFSFLGVNIPVFTYGTSYSITEQSNSQYRKSIEIKCYGVTSDEVDAYRDELLAEGFYSAYYLFYDHGERWWNDITVMRSSNSQNQTHTIQFSVTGEEPDYTLPENLQIRYNESTLFNYTITKIGDSYLRYNEYYDEYEYYVKNGKTYVMFWKEGQEEWQRDEDYTYDIDDVDYNVFSFITNSADIDETTFSGEDTLLGRQVNVYTVSWGYTTDTYYKDVETGLILKEQFGSYVAEVTSFDTSVTSFGNIELPSLD